jgi:murein DD-endopeptidase MepM/ murein hydrolase activator NlpD
LAFVMIATGATSRARVRTLPMRPLAAVGALAALALLGAGGTLGYWLGTPAAPAHVEAKAASTAAPAHPALPFTLEQVGAISARLFRLESEAAQLSHRIGVLNKEAPAAARAPSRGDGPSAVRSDDASARPAPASGGPLLAPRPEPADIGVLDAQLRQVERQIASVAEAAIVRSLALMRLPTRSPIVDAELSSGFGNRSDPLTHGHAFHAGLDFAATSGTPIASAGGGVVAFAGFKHDYGWCVEIDHGNGLVTRYAHASELLVQAGQIVVPGQRIGRVGSTGRSTGPHLHFEVLRGGTPIDPERYLAHL